MLSNVYFCSLHCCLQLAAGNIVNGSLIFSHSKSQARDSDPPEFALNFSVSTFPPTYVTCQVETTQVEIFNLTREVVINEYNKSLDLVPQINVSVTLRERMAGNYQCIVTVFRSGESNLTLYTDKISIQGEWTCIKPTYNTCTSCLTASTYHDTNRQVLWVL